MTLNASGPISLGGSTVGQSINLELGNSATALASINSTQFRTLAGVASGQISLSNFYGKSNTIGWFASFGVSTSETTMRGLATNSSGKVYFQSSSSVAGSDMPVIQVSTAGAIAYQRNGYFPSISGYKLVTVDSSGNYYMLGRNSSNRPEVTKYNSSDTLQWNVYWTESDYSSGMYMNSNMAVDSSGNVFVAFMGARPACCTILYHPAVRKLNSSGAIVAGRDFNIRPGDGQDLPYGLGVDSSGNVYLVSAAETSCGVINSTFIAKFNNGLTFQSRVNYYISGGTGCHPRGFVFDTANSVGYVAGTIASLGNGYIWKINTSLGVVWSYKTSDTGYWTDIAVDSSGNVYAVSVFTVASTGKRAVKIIKLDSSGSLQWARYMRPSTLNVDTSGTSISVSGSTITVGAKISDGTNAQNRAFVFQVPTSGAGAGTTFTNNSVSWTYNSYTETLSTVTLTNGNNGSATAYAYSGTASVTPTLTTSAYTAVTTTL